MFSCLTTSQKGDKMGKENELKSIKKNVHNKKSRPESTMQPKTKKLSEQYDEAQIQNTLNQNKQLKKMIRQLQSKLEQQQCQLKTSKYQIQNTLNQNQRLQSKLKQQQCQLKTIKQLNNTLTNTNIQNGDKINKMNQQHILQINRFQKVAIQLNTRIQQLNQLFNKLIKKNTILQLKINNKNICKLNQMLSSMNNCDCNYKNQDIKSKQTLKTQCYEDIYGNTLNLSRIANKVESPEGSSDQYSKYLGDQVEKVSEAYEKQLVQEVYEKQEVQSKQSKQQILQQLKQTQQRIIINKQNETIKKQQLHGQLSHKTYDNNNNKTQDEYIFDNQILAKMKRQ